MVEDGAFTNKIDCYNFQGDSKSQKASKSQSWFKSYDDFAEWVDFTYWWSFSGEGSASAACVAGLLLIMAVDIFLLLQLMMAVTHHLLTADNGSNMSLLASQVFWVIQ